MDDATPMQSRRRLLAGLGVATTGTLAGCTERIWSAAEETPPEQVSLTIKTVPRDDDPLAAKITNRLVENLRAVGIDAGHEPVAVAELHREILIDRDFDIFVTRHHGFEDFDALRPLLHSRFVGERGWQNPFGFSDVTVDEYLEEQMTASGYARRATLEEFFDHILHSVPAPYSVLAFPRHLGAAAEGVTLSRPPRYMFDYFELFDELIPNDDHHVRIGLFGQGIGTRLNPIVVDLNDVRTILGLLYDPLFRITDNKHIPWLCETISWEESRQHTAATVRLRDDLRWHDGETIDGEDVIFTMEFLEDTSMGELEGGLPAPRYRGHQTLIDEIDAVADDVVRFQFGDVSREVARQSLTIPILPKHIWEEKSSLVGEHRTEALVWDNEEPVGSGLFMVSEAPGSNGITLEPFEEHAFQRLDDADLPDVLTNGAPNVTLEFRTSPNPGAVIEALVEGEIDLIASELPPEETERIDEEEGVRTLDRSTKSFYMIGYNVRHSELSDPQFRQILSRLIDRRHLVDELFDGRADPAVTQNRLVGIHGNNWTNEREHDVAEFPGTDGEIDEETVQSLFEEIGYRYEDGELLV